MLTNKAIRKFPVSKLTTRPSDNMVGNHHSYIIELFDWLVSNQQIISTQTEFSKNVDHVGNGIEVFQPS